jgi:hypothetical protein
MGGNSNQFERKLPGGSPIPPRRNVVIEHLVSYGASFDTKKLFFNGLPFSPRQEVEWEPDPSLFFALLITI